MAKKEARRAARNKQAVKRAGPRQPTIKRAAIQGAVLAVIYFLLVQYAFRSDVRSTISNVLWSVIFLVMYTGLIYYWERYLYRRRNKPRNDKK